MNVKMYIISTNTIVGNIIKFLTFSRWSHVVISFDDNTFIDSVAFDGVRLYTKKDFEEYFKKYEVIPITLTKYYDARQFALEQVNKGYDWKAIFGYLFHKRRKWQDENRWFCSELVAAILLKGGRKLFRSDL
ncbi:MAG TPA: hypothetical protein V6C58_20620, partial [Allocoleopsis sp.]